jgi:transcription elongation factor Elf1
MWQVCNLGDMSIRCPFCQALHWRAETLKKHSSIANPKFGMCCYKGTISIPSLQPPPVDLYQLLTNQDQVAKDFRHHIRTYNSALAMTSVGRMLDTSINQGGRGPYTFRLHGELIHRAGSLLPPEDGNTLPTYAQLYIYDPAMALNHRMANRWNSELDRATLATLQDMLHRSHYGVELYKQAYELTRDLPPEQQCRIALHFDPSSDHCRYQTPHVTFFFLFPYIQCPPQGLNSVTTHVRTGKFPYREKAPSGLST